MSSSRRSFLKTGLAFGGLGLLLPGCGFQPLYGQGPDAALSEPLTRVKIANIPDRPGQMLRNQLIDRFYRDGRPVDPDYTLNIGLAATKVKLGIQVDDTATRAQLILNANFNLTDPAGRVVFTQISRSIIDYGILQNQYASMVAEDDAFKRGINQVAQDITTRVTLYLAREPETPPVTPT
jgi:LPS-assembly lipoprotein